MNRRRFLSTTMLSGAGIGIGLGLALGKAKALTMQSCAAGAANPACNELIRHRTLLTQLDSMLKAQGLDAAQRKAALASAICPFCGQPLIG